MSKIHFYVTHNDHKALLYLFHLLFQSTKFDRVLAGLQKRLFVTYKNGFM